MPSSDEREEIFKIHLENRGQNINHLNLKELAQNSQGYTGAEIEQAVKDAIVATFNMFHEGKDAEDAERVIDGLSNLKAAQDVLLTSLRNITPLSVLKKRR